MHGHPGDTIAAVATAPGRGGVGIVRVSGPLVPQIAEALLGSLPRPRNAGFHAFRDAGGSTIDRGLALYFSAPSSFTGEHVLELHGHGGQLVMQMLLARVVELGARMARPGEFSERAFLNDKIDLAQAEAIADLIDSASEQAARAAIRSLEGVFSRQVQQLANALTRTRMYVEAAIDFPEEEIDFLSDAGLHQQLQQLQENLGLLLESTCQGQLLRDGITIVIAGRPNAGKSSLMNALSGREAAIVTDIPGTTRDVLREQVHMAGLPLHLVDTAGLHDSHDPVELAGMARARSALQSADHVLLVVDDSRGWCPEDAEIVGALPVHVTCTRVYNKIDLSGRSPGVFSDEGAPAVSLSLHDGAGLKELREYLVSSAGFHGTGEGTFTARRRHLDALQRASVLLASGNTHLSHDRSGELLAEDLRLAQQALGEITGQMSSDELLGRIFSSFCIGK
jgi:tRNA modification GTPase